MTRKMQSTNRHPLEDKSLLYGHKFLKNVELRPFDLYVCFLCWIFHLDSFDKCRGKVLFSCKDKYCKRRQLNANTCVLNEISRLSRLPKWLSFEIFS